jgi:hypothetical protein
VADVDDDGLVDLIAQAGAIVTLFRVDASAGMIAGPSSQLDEFAQLTSVARIASHMDLVGANQDMLSLDIYAGRGDGTFGAGRHCLAGTYPTDPYAVDLDGKNGLDFIISGADRLSIVLDPCP